MNKSVSKPVPINIGVAGYVTPYKIHKSKITGNETTEELLAKAEKFPGFKNLILNVGLDNWFSANTSTIASQCAVGSGASEPTVTQTGLDSLVATTGNRTVESGSIGSPDWYVFYRGTYTFALGAVVANISEIALKASTIYTTRALIRDSEGTPTTITVTADEQLIIVYELRKYPPLIDVAGTLTLSVNDVPTDYDVVIRAANVDDVTFGFYNPINNLSSAGTGSGYVTAFGSQMLGSVDAIFPGTSSDGLLSAEAYTPGNYYRDYTAEFSLTQGNLSGGIGGLGFFGNGSNRHGFQISIDPKIDKNADRVLSIPVRLAWARI